MIVSTVDVPRSRFMGFGEMSWEEWCDKTWGGNPELLSKCKSKPWGVLSAAPWTEVGALQRGIPKSNPSLVTDIISAAGGSFTPGGNQPINVTTDGIFGIPRMVMYVGGGVLALGLLAAVATRSKRRRK